MDNVEVLRERLSPFQIELSELEPHLRVDDSEAILLLVGTFNEGLANETSDIDLLLVYPRGRYVRGLSKVESETAKAVSPVIQGDSSFASDNVLIVNRTLEHGQKLQITVTTEEYVVALQDGIVARNDGYREQIAGVAAGKQRQGRILNTMESQLVVHRFYSGLVLRNSLAAQRLRARMPLQEAADSVAIRGTSALQILSLDVKGLLLSHGREELETVLFLHNQMLLHLSSVLLATVDNITPGEKLFFRLLKRHREEIGTSIVSDVLDRYAQAPRFAREDPGGIVPFVNDVLGRARLSPLVAAEYANWSDEATYPLFARRR